MLGATFAPSPIAARASAGRGTDERAADTANAREEPSRTSRANTARARRRATREGERAEDARARTRVLPREELISECQEARSAGNPIRSDPNARATGGVVMAKSPCALSSTAAADAEVMRGATNAPRRVSPRGVASASAIASAAAATLQSPGRARARSSSLAATRQRVTDDDVDANANANAKANEDDDDESEEEMIAPTQAAPASLPMPPAEEDGDGEIDATTTTTTTTTDAAAAPTQTIAKPASEHARALEQLRRKIEIKLDVELEYGWRVAWEDDAGKEVKTFYDPAAPGKKLRGDKDAITHVKAKTLRAAAAEAEAAAANAAAAAAAARARAAKVAADLAELEAEEEFEAIKAAAEAQTAAARRALEEKKRLLRAQAAAAAAEASQGSTPTLALPAPAAGIEPAPAPARLPTKLAALPPAEAHDEPPTLDSLDDEEEEEEAAADDDDADAKTAAYLKDLARNVRKKAGLDIASVGWKVEYDHSETPGVKPKLHIYSPGRKHRFKGPSALIEYLLKHPEEAAKYGVVERGQEETLSPENAASRAEREAAAWTELDAKVREATGKGLTPGWAVKWVSTCTGGR